MESEIKFLESKLENLHKKVENENKQKEKIKSLIKYEEDEKMSLKEKINSISEEYTSLVKERTKLWATLPEKFLKTSTNIVLEEVESSEREKNEENFKKKFAAIPSNQQKDNENGVDTELYLVYEAINEIFKEKLEMFSNLCFNHIEKHPEFTQLEIKSLGVCYLESSIDILDPSLHRKQVFTLHNNLNLIDFIKEALEFWEKSTDIGKYEIYFTNSKGIPERVDLKDYKTSIDLFYKIVVGKINSAELYIIQVSEYSKHFIYLICLIYRKLS